MTHFFKSASVDSDFKNFDNLSFKTMCDWLREIHTQNKRISNQINGLVRLINDQDDTVYHNVEPDKGDMD